MRLVFLLDRIPTNVEKALDRFGSRLIRWEVEPPTPDEQLALRKEGMAEGLEFQVERVLSRINQPCRNSLSQAYRLMMRASLQLDLDETLRGATEAGEREADDMRALFEEEETKRRSSSVALVVLLLLLGSGATVVAGFVSPALGQQLNRSLC